MAAPCTATLVLYLVAAAGEDGDDIADTGDMGTRSMGITLVDRLVHDVVL